jgi:hypothetical protein
LAAPRRSVSRSATVPRSNLLRRPALRWSLRASWCFGLLVGAGLVTSCVVTTEPGFPSAARRVTPPAQFSVWWRVTESCAGVQRDFHAVQWYVVPDEELNVDGVHYDGYTWSGASPRIVVEESMLDAAGSLIRHEMLHALLNRGGHPRQYFVERCGDIVSCEARCVDEAGGYPPPTTTDAIVDADRLEVRAFITPTPVSRSADSSWLAVVVEAHNPLPIPIRVRIDKDIVRGGFSGIQFWYEATGGLALGMTGTLDSLVAFGAGQTHRAVFDAKAHVPGPFDVQLGPQLLTGGFSGMSGSSVAFDVVP